MDTSTAGPTSPERAMRANCNSPLAGPVTLVASTMASSLMDFIRTPSLPKADRPKPHAGGLGPSRGETKVELPCLS